MERRLRVRHTAVAWFAGRAPWLGAGTAFAPLAAMARQALDIGDDDASEVGIGSFEQASRISSPMTASASGYLLAWRC